MDPPARAHLVRATITAVMSLSARTVVLVLGAGLLVGGCSPKPPPPPGADQESGATTAKPVGGSAGSGGETLPCGDVIASAEGPAPGHTVLLGQVALPTAVALQANPSGESETAARLFAKDGLQVRPGASLEISIPADASGQASIGWGNPGKRTSRLVIAGCGKSSTEKAWLVYAGGYWVARPMCLPLVVTSGPESRQISIGIGEACPGQAPPPPPAAP